MADSLPILLVPGLNCSPAPLRAADAGVMALRAGYGRGPHPRRHHRGDRRRILAAAPPRFALAGLSMGGYIAMEIVRQAADRVVKLALLDTGARADTPEATAKRAHQHRARARAAVSTR